MRRLLNGSLASCLVLPLIFAQVQNARIEGTVQDTSGAVVPGAKLSIVNIRTEVRLEAEANPSGFYTFPTLQPGFYKLSSLPAFARPIRSLKLRITIELFLF